jgi:DMSO/TMAO reductase YedYZ molybdopterin-dependent catalytic subunit
MTVDNKAKLSNDVLLREQTAKVASQDGASVLLKWLGVLLPGKNAGPLQVRFPGKTGTQLHEEWREAIRVKCLAEGYLKNVWQGSYGPWNTVNGDI